MVDQALPIRASCLNRAGKMPRAFKHFDLSRCFRPLRVQDRKRFPDSVPLRLMTAVFCATGCSRTDYRPRVVRCTDGSGSTANLPADSWFHGLSVACPCKPPPDAASSCCEFRSVLRHLTWMVARPCTARIPGHDIDLCMFARPALPHCVCGEAR